MAAQLGPWLDRPMKNPDLALARMRELSGELLGIRTSIAVLQDEVAWRETELERIVHGVEEGNARG